ncbi:SDR family NAD(P)-dependent oxidoreductase [Nostoc sp.]|uniref:SDR family NAD(P)-dependent oxidoreductase n=1 Tax=Nostoc sp. TaxID=1180 RepID=UPI002FFD0807
MEIQGKVALITGASRGIGRAIALELAQLGIQKLILVARDRQKLVEVANEIEAMGTETAIVALDLTQTIEVNIAIAQLWRNYGQIHLLVNCAGVAYQSSFLQSKMPQVQEELSVNLFGMYNLTSLIARRMASQRQGTIVNVSSLMGKVAAPTMATYSATKFAILGFTQALRRELAEYNIRVIALLPSLTDTDMMRDLKLFRWVIPMTPQQVAKALVTGMQNDSPEILVGWQSYLAVLCQRLAPWLLELILKIATPPAARKQQPGERLNKLIPKLNFLTRIHRFGDLFLSRT